MRSKCHPKVTKHEIWSTLAFRDSNIMSCKDLGFSALFSVTLDSGYYLTFKSTYLAEKPKKLAKTKLNVKILGCD